VRRVRRALLERLDDHRFDAVVADASWHPGSHLVKEPIETITRKARAPLADSDRMNSQCHGHLAIRRARRDAKDDARAQRDRLGGLSSSCQRLELVALVWCQHDLRHRTTSARTLFLHGCDHSESLSEYFSESLTQDTSHEVTLEWTSVDVGGHSTSSDQQIWTLMDIGGRSGNTLKVPGSRPGRPTKSLFRGPI